MAELVEREGRYFLIGELDRETVPVLWQGRNQQMPQQSPLVLDLSELTRVDSAGMAMLIHIAQDYQKNGVDFSVTNPPQQLVTLLRLSHAEGLLPTV
ncbi:STAS domain-containing protein [Thaumasiovibrio subtropicus]|uniref:STAS domain-containing protein n=1 Tax=Thaumasiovibrio subtropicus TaxID=1891207 RepID=UPI000B364377|nr:STAS domain-containing protein [Thaumasiovibrio subtropicus]